jgi:hypothetical protein
MKQVIYTKENKKFIRELVKEIDPKIVVSFQDREWYNRGNVVNVGVECVDIFQNWFKKTFPQCKDINWWLIQLLHEIGHYETRTRKISNQLFEDYALMQMEMDLISPFKRKKMEKYYHIKHFTLFGELEATTWGANYYLRFKNKLDNIFIERN